MSQTRWWCYISSENAGLLAAAIRRGISKEKQMELKKAKSQMSNKELMAEYSDDEIKLLLSERRALTEEERELRRKLQRCLERADRNNDAIGEWCAEMRRELSDPDSTK